MGRSKFPGKPSKHTHRKRINVLPPSGDILNIEFGNPVTVKVVEENKQDGESSYSDNESAPIENIPKVSLTRRLTRDMKKIRNKNASKRSLLSKICNKSSKRSNLSCKTLHNFTKNCRESTNLVGKFVLPTRSVHSSRVIKPNKRFISDVNESVTLKRQMSITKRQEEDKSKALGSFNSEQECDIDKTAFSNGHKVVLRKARLKLPNHTGTQGPFSTITNSFPPGTVTCGVCGAVRFYRFIKQARKFNIYSCESCRKFIAKMIKRLSCGNKNAQNPLVCHKGQGTCHVSSVVRSQQRKLTKCAYKARCPACWLKMCLRTFHMPSSLKQGLTMMLPKDMQSIFNNSLTPITWQTNVLLEKPTGEEPVKRRPVRNLKPTAPVNVPPATSDINRQKVDLKGPRVKHVCRSASIVLGQPIATFSEGEKKSDSQDRTNNTICDKSALDTGKCSSGHSEAESSCSEKFTKAQCVSNDFESSGRREKSYRNLTNLYSCSEVRNSDKKKYISEPEPESENGILIDYWEVYDPDYIHRNGFSIISSDSLPMPAICYLCGSAGRETMIHCSACCESFHLFCVNLPLSLSKERLQSWTCENCSSCDKCGSMDKDILFCIKCKRAFHESCSNIKPRDSKLKVCSKCTECVNCGTNSTGDNIGNVPLCIACFQLRRKDKFCSICTHRYAESESISKVLECTRCSKWVHSTCENLAEEQYQMACVLPRDIQYICTACSKDSSNFWKKCIAEELTLTFNKVMRLLLRNKTARHLLKTSFSNAHAVKMKKIQLVDNAEYDNNIRNASDKKIDTIVDIKHKLNFGRYKTIKSFCDDVIAFCKMANLDELLNIFNDVLQEVFPWYEDTSSTTTLLVELGETSEEYQISDSNTQTFCDTRMCKFCKGIGDGPTNQESRLIYCSQNQWVHVNCALWSYEVYESIDNSLQNVHIALNRSRTTRCSHCKLKGASVDCCYRGCHETYHFKCARIANVDFMTDKTMYCSSHDMKKCKEVTNFRVGRSVYVELDSNKKKCADIDRVHFMVGSLYVKSLGKIEPSISDCVDAIVPIGFVCARLFWSTVEPWKLVPYTISTSLHNPNSGSATINKNFTIDHTLETTALEKIMRELNCWQKDLEKKNIDIDSEDDEEQQHGADILSPELTDAILEELPHDLLDGISVQDIFPKLSCDEIVSLDFKNEFQNSDGFSDFEDPKNRKDLKQNKIRPPQRSCSLTLSCKLNGSLSPAMKKRKMVTTRENNMLYQILQVDGNCDDSSSSECGSPTRNFWVDYVPEEPVTCEKCQCTYRTQASYKRHLDSCEVICTSESDSETVPDQEIISTYTNASTTEEDLVTVEVSEQPVVISSYETYQSEIHTSVNTQNFLMSKSTAEMMVPQSTDVIIQPIEQQAIAVEAAPHQEPAQYCISQTVPLCMNQPIALQQDSIQINPPSNQILSINPNASITINSPNQIAFNSINQQTIDFQQTQPVTIQPATYNNAILNAAAVNGKLINPVLPTVNVSNASWVKPTAKPTIITQKTIRARPRNRTIATKREEEIIIVPAQNSNGQVLVSANYVPTFMDTFQQPSQNIQYIATIAPQVNTLPSQPIVQIQPENNLISIVPGIQQTMYIQQPRVVENQLVVDSSGNLGWTQQQTVQPVYYGFETIVQNTVMQSQQFLPTTVPGILTANSSYSTTTQVFQTSKLEPVLDVSSNSFMLVNPINSQSVINSQPVVSSQPLQPIVNHAPQPHSMVNSHHVVNPQHIINSHPLITSEPLVNSQSIVNAQPLASSQSVMNSQPIVSPQPVLNHQQIITQQQIITSQPPMVETQLINSQPVINTQAIISDPRAPAAPTQEVFQQPPEPVQVVPQATKHKIQQVVNIPQQFRADTKQLRPPVPVQAEIKASQIHLKPQNRKYITSHKPVTPVTSTNSITLPTAPFVSEQRIPTNIVTPIPKITSQSRPMSRVLPMPTNNILKEKKNDDEEFFLNDAKKSAEIISFLEDTKKAIAASKVDEPVPPLVKHLKIESKVKEPELVKLPKEKIKKELVKPPMVIEKCDESVPKTVTEKLVEAVSIEVPPGVPPLPSMPSLTPGAVEPKVDTSLKLVFQKQSQDGTYKVSNNFTSKQNVSKFVTKQPVQIAPLKPIKSQKDKEVDKYTLSNAVKKESENEKSSILYTVESKDGFKYSSTSVTDLWSKVLDAVQAARAAHKMPPLPFNSTAVNSIHILGLKSNGLKYLIEQLPGATKCTKYKPLFKFPPHPSKIDEECMQDHAYGTIRCAPYEKKNTEPYDMFGWLSSRHRQPGEISLDTLELLPRRVVNLPIAMKFRQLKLTSKYSVGVYRSCIHGRGLFCLRDIEAGEMVIEYAGEVIRSVLTDKREKFYNSKGIGCYMFRVDDNFVVDATMKGNAARFINHSCDPNCYSKVVEILGHKHIIIFALRRILSGEELTYDYKFPFEEDKIPCTCGSRKCRKFLN